MKETCIPRNPSNIYEFPEGSGDEHNSKIVERLFNNVCLAFGQQRDIHGYEHRIDVVLQTLGICAIYNKTVHQDTYFCCSAKNFQYS